MNSSFPSNAPRQAPLQGAPPEVRQTPSVPISVYRELATELKATQAMVDSLTQQNQQLSQQNQVFRREMLNFAESADRLRQAVEQSQPHMQPTAAAPQPFTPPTQELESEPLGLVNHVDEDRFDEAASLPERWGDSMGAGVSNLANHLTRLVAPKPKKEVPHNRPGGVPAPAKRKPPVLYTEERLEPSRASSQASGGSGDLSGLWLATTILLIVVSAFGAGFVIMKPLLNNSR